MVSRKDKVKRVRKPTRSRDEEKNPAKRIPGNSDDDTMPAVEKQTPDKLR